MSRSETGMSQVDLNKENINLGAGADRLLRLSGIVGVVSLILAGACALFIEGGASRVYQSYLVSFMFYLSLALGGLFFVLIHHRARAGWSVVVCRLNEALAANLLWMALLAIPILIGFGDLYVWSNKELVATDPLLQHKQPYLNVPFFLIRLFIYFGLWIMLSQYFYKRSVEQDLSQDKTATKRMEKWSAPGILIFALTVTFAAFDLIMSRDPHWFSTIFGVYYFAGCLIAIFSTLPILLTLLQRSGRLNRIVTADHFHDLGKYLFGFVVFWAYIAFSQFMLIWYANIPEETVWYIRRFNGDWLTMSYFLMVGHFFIPFALLISRFPKRRPKLLSLCCLWLLFVHWVDLYWLIMPESTPAGELGLSIVDLATFVAIGGFFFAGMAYWLRDRNLIPVGDPRLGESLAFENA
jgi:hypothetical protein